MEPVGQQSITINDLCDDNLKIILSYASKYDLENSTHLVCKRWNVLAKSCQQTLFSPELIKQIWQEFYAHSLRVTEMIFWNEFKRSGITVTIENLSNYYRSAQEAGVGFRSRPVEAHVIDLFISSLKSNDVEKVRYVYSAKIRAMLQDRNPYRSSSSVIITSIEDNLYLKKNITKQDACVRRWMRKNEPEIHNRLIKKLSRRQKKYLNWETLEYC
jgi:hypothetical protein